MYLLIVTLLVRLGRRAFLVLVSVEPRLRTISPALLRCSFDKGVLSEVKGKF